MIKLKIRDRDKVSRKYLWVFLLIAVIVSFIILQNQAPIVLGKIFEQKNEIHFRLSTSAYNKIVNPGEDVIINSNIVKFGGTERIDVSIEVDVKNPNGELIDKSLETFAIETQVNIIKKIHIFGDATPGKYRVDSRLFYNDEEVAVSESVFEVKEKNQENFTRDFIFISIITTLVLLVISLIMFIRHMKKRH